MDLEGGKSRYMYSSNSVPGYVISMLEKLHGAGYAAYLVGGCVRDMVLGTSPHDYDICTDALPEQIIAVFGEENCTQYGRAFGTCGVRCGGGFSEITTFRTEADYTDFRHPDRVEFAHSIGEDLSRRDFTCNAMAWHPQEGLLDPYHGQEDLKSGVLRCVGVPSVRFREDALRILRGMRFAARLGLHPEPLTEAAMRAGAGALRYISAERVFNELCNMLMGEHITQVLMAFPHVLGVWIPEILPCIGFSQHSRFHDFTVWEHTARAVGAAPQEITVRLTMLLHDLGKPACYTNDAKGGHFKGHARRGAVMADEILRRLRCDNHLRMRVVRLVDWHRFTPETLPQVRRLLGKLGEEELRMLLQVLDADRLSKRMTENESRARIEHAELLLGQCIGEGLCCTLRELAVGGRDMQAMGLSGEAIGEMLRWLLDAVINGTAENEREQLLTLAGRRCSGNDLSGGG